MQKRTGVTYKVESQSRYWDELEMKQHEKHLAEGYKPIDGQSGIKYFTFEQYETCIINFAKSLYEGFAIDDFNRSIIHILSLYFFQDPRFETEGYGSLNKGIMLRGNTGTGKTLLMNIFQHNAIGKYKVINCNTTSDWYQRAGIEYLFSETPGSHIVHDDLGSEATSVKYMGTDINPMQRIILEHYELGRPFNDVHFTTNLSADEIEAVYGQRVRSRLREMCNPILLPGEDRRK